jgi:NifU-like protein
MWDYSPKVKDHFLHPRNVGEIAHPDAMAEVGNITCGDALKLMLKIDKDERILDAKFQTFGCASAIASSSAITEMVKGLTLDEAAKLSNDDIADFLDGLPEAKMHCSVMGMEALQKAIADFRGKKTIPEEEGKIVCRCFGVTDNLIEKVVREHDLTTIEQVTHYSKAGGGCGGCHADIQAIIDRVQAATKASAAAAPTPPPAGGRKKALTNLERIKLIEEVVEREIRPWLRNDGGDIEIVDIDRSKVTVALRGTCTNCLVSHVTLKSVVQDKLRELVDESIHVEQVGA